MEFDGEFETHVTIRVKESSGVDTLRGWAAARFLKFHHIVLDRGLTTSQPMVSRKGRGSLSGERSAANDLHRQLIEDGFEVSRIKIEAAPWNRDVPASDVEAVDRHPNRYFEHHVKLALGPEADIPALSRLAQEHDAHLSRNALRVQTNGRAERFVTQRCHEVGRPTAQERLNKLMAALKEADYTVLKVEEEFVVLDSDPGVDAGWIESGGLS